MNYIYFNPREWYLEKTQYNTQYQNNSFWQQNSTWQTATERCFINDFDGGLVESLMFGDWNDTLVRMISDSHELVPDTKNCFVFWLNGGENDKYSEICQLQISFFDNPANCYTYKLNRNYIKPLLHRQGWELYSIPFTTPAAGLAPVATRFSFVARNAPMALKPAKEPSFYKDWADEPDEFAKWRPQRHNLVFEDGWPTINMYGGDTYSTEAIRRRLEREAANPQKAPKPANNHTGSREAEEGSWEAEEGWCDLEARLDECNMRKEELTGRQEELSEQRHDLQMRFEEQQNSRFIDENDCAEIETILSETQEWTSSFPQLLALDAQLSVADEMISKHSVPVFAVEGILDGIEDQLDSVEELCDNREERLDELDGLICDLEDAAESNED